MPKFCTWFCSVTCAVLAAFAFAEAMRYADARETEAGATKVEKSKEVKIIKTWTGSVDNDKHMKPECIVSQIGLVAVWKAWKVEGDLPKVDFTKHLIIAAYSSGSVVNIKNTTLDDKGNLEFIAISTADFGTGFRYAMGTISREGVKTVNKKDLPKE